MAEAELEAKIVPDTSAIEDVEDREIGITGDGGGDGLSPSQRNQRKGVVSGGLKTAFKALGLVGLLTSLKPVIASISAVLGTISRALIPAIELLTEALRPFVSFVNDFIADPVEALGGEGSIGNTVAQGIVQNNPVVSAIASGFSQTADLDSSNSSDPSIINEGVLQSLANTIENISDGGTGSPDQSGEADKQDTFEDLLDTFDGKLGGGTI